MSFVMAGVDVAIAAPIADDHALHLPTIHDQSFVGVWFTISGSPETSCCVDPIRTVTLYL